MEAEEAAEGLTGQGRERRTRPRYAVDEDASLLLVGHGLAVQCRVIDLSLEGCRMRTRERFPAAIRARVEVTFKINGIAFRFSGAVQWTDGRYEVGIHFVDVSSRRSEEWAEVLSEVAADNAARAERQAAAERAAEERAQQEAEEQANDETEAPPLVEQRGAAPPEIESKQAPYPVAALQPARSVLADAPSACSSQPATPEAAELQLVSQRPAKAVKRERREQCRHGVDTSAVIYLVKMASKLSGRILDLSASGCRIRTDERFPVGIHTRVETEFRLEGLPFRLGGVIQAIHDRQHVGVRFLDLSDRKREQVAKGGDSGEMAVEGQGPENAPQALLVSPAAPTAYQVEDQDDDRNDDQNVDQAAADMEGEAEEPQNQKNDKNCPKHIFSFAPWVHGIQKSFPGAQEHS
jgi:hypothetical protein